PLRWRFRPPGRPSAPVERGRNASAWFSPSLGSYHCFGTVDENVPLVPLLVSRLSPYDTIDPARGRTPVAVRTIVESVTYAVPPDGASSPMPLSVSCDPVIDSVAVAAPLPPTTMPAVVPFEIVVLRMSTALFAPPIVGWIAMPQFPDVEIELAMCAG